jgi:hypothetical protein
LKWRRLKQENAVLVLPLFYVRLLGALLITAACEKTHYY